MSYTSMFILGSVCNVFESDSCSDVPIGRFNNVNKSCKVIVGNPPIDQGLKSLQFWDTRVIRLS